MAERNKIADGLQVLGDLGMPRAQQNDRSALCLLALLNLSQGESWAAAKNPFVGITPIMQFARDHYGKQYAPNTRETFRRQTMHQLVAAGIALYATTRRCLPRSDRVSLSNSATAVTPMPLNKGWREFLELLNSNGVEYPVVGIQATG